MDERKKALQKLFDLHDPKGTFVIDNLENALEKAYNAFPDRIYVVKNGKIVFKGGQGPFKCVPEKLKQWFKSNL